MAQRQIVDCTLQADLLIFLNIPTSLTHGQHLRAEIVAHGWYVSFAE